ncbi:MAG TPA: DUF1054 family protein [Candidatus Binataceae bacterium]
MKTTSRLGFTPADFAVFKIADFDARMQEIDARVRPRLARLADELTPELARRLNHEFYSHLARHGRRTVDPPRETWAAFGPSPRGYQRHGHLALCVSSAGLHARIVVKPQADGRASMAHRIATSAAALARSLRGTRIARYENWNFNALPAETAADEALFASLAEGLGKKTGGIDLGFGWNVRDAIRLDRAELLDAYRELEPLYRIVIGVV